MCPIQLEAWYAISATIATVKHVIIATAHLVTVIVTRRN